MSYVVPGIVRSIVLADPDSDPARQLPYTHGVSKDMETESMVTSQNSRPKQTRRLESILPPWAYAWLSWRKPYFAN